MKNIDKKFLTCGLFVMMTGLGWSVSAGAQTSSDTVSAIGDTTAVPPPPSAADDTVVKEEDTTKPAAAVPAKTNTDTASATGDFPPMPSATAAAAPAVNAVPTPSQDALTTAAPPAPAATNPLNETTTGTAQGNVMGSTGAKSTYSGQYYDSQSILPSKELSAAGVTGPRMVDPTLEPGSKYVVVEKNAAAGSFESQYVAATRALKLGRYAAAMEMFQNLYEKNRKDPRILMGLGVAQQGAGFAESAAKTYGELLDVQPNNADAIINLMGIMKGQYPSVTLQRLMELREKYPLNPGVPAQIGLVNAELKNYDDAIRYLQIASTMQPDNPAYVYNMAIITDRQGNAKKAIELYEQALQLDAVNADSVQGLPRDQIYDRLVILRRKV